jgi:hypothetical protein
MGANKSNMLSRNKAGQMQTLGLSNTMGEQSTRMEEQSATAAIYNNTKFLNTSNRERAQKSHIHLI